MRSAAFVALASLLPSAAPAQPEPGDFLALETTAGSIVNITGGGDVSGAPRFATGFTMPADLCLGPGGDLFVAEQGGDLLVATAGGDLSAAVPFASGLGQPIGLLCTASQILVADFDGRIVDATAGGDFAAAAPFAEGLFTVAHLLRASDGTVYALRVLGDVYDVTAGGDFSAATPFATGIDSGAGIAQHGAQLLITDGDGERFLDATAGGDLSAAVPFATGIAEPRGLVSTPDLGLFTVARAEDAVYEISSGGDHSSATPFATGVATDIGRFLYVPGCDPGPREGCIAAAKGKLLVDERKPGKEKLALSLAKLATPVGPAELGDPVAGLTRYDLCLYGGTGELAGALHVTRGGDLCGEAPCWKSKGAAGLVYKDPSATADGVAKLSVKGAEAGKSKLSLEARNKVRKGQTALPALAARLAGAASARAQVVTTDGACFELAIGTVKKAEATLFRGLTELPAPK